jgi:demethylmenaquinone methyltransferase/2-methoxy-6-polyprenyl-1,4-benzoquinol methylase
MKTDYKKKESWHMFNRIARRYDVLNRLLSGRQDVRWRQKCAEQLPDDKPITVLDLATGTGDLLRQLIKDRPNIKIAIGLDPAIDMLCIGQKKLSPYGGQMLHGDAQAISLKNETADVITMAFGIRNVPDINAAFTEMYRVLKPDGRALILEFSLPDNRFIRTVYLIYFRHVLPFIGGLISGDRAAYKYLNQTVEDFPYGEAFCKRLEHAGFQKVTAAPLTFGIATLYSAAKL